MPRPPLGPTTMEYTVKFRLRGDEYRMLQQIARNRPVSAALRDLIHDEHGRMKNPE